MSVRMELTGGILNLGLRIILSTDSAIYYLKDIVELITDPLYKARLVSGIRKILLQ